MSFVLASHLIRVVDGWSSSLLILEPYPPGLLSVRMHVRDFSEQDTCKARGEAQHLMPVCSWLMSSIAPRGGHCHAVSYWQKVRSFAAVPIRELVF